MTGAGYRWTASFGIFLGGVTTALMISAFLPFRFRDELLATIVWFSMSLLGVAVSLVSLFLHADRPDRESPLNHRSLGYVAVALNGWPWILFVWVCWLVRLTLP